MRSVGWSRAFGAMDSLATTNDLQYWHLSPMPLFLLSLLSGTRQYCRSRGAKE